MLRRLLPLGLIGACVIAACGSDPGSVFGTSSSSGSSGFPGDGGGTITGGAEKDGPPPATPIECNKMDIVFIIDNSVSMKEEQTSLVNSIPGFIKLIEEYKTAGGELLDYRIGILSTDVTNDKGIMRKSRGLDPDTTTCDPLDNNKPWLERSDATDAGPKISDVFACRARLGTLGDPTELPLESAKLALYERTADGENTLKSKGESFLRKEALLAFIIITDEDEGGGDHDPRPVAFKNTPDYYAKQFDDVKEGYRARWATAVIAGDNGTNGQGCSSSLGTADNAVRLQRFVDNAKPNGVFSSICKDDFSGALKEAFDVFSNACKGFPGVK